MTQSSNNPATGVRSVSVVSNSHIILYAIAAVVLSGCSPTAQLIDTLSIAEVNQHLNEAAGVPLRIGHSNQILVSRAFDLEIGRDSVYYSRSANTERVRQSIPLGRVGEIYRPRKTGAGRGALIGIAPGTIGMALTVAAIPSCNSESSQGCGLGILAVAVYSAGAFVLGGVAGLLIGSNDVHREKLVYYRGPPGRYVQ